MKKNRMSLFSPRPAAGSALALSMLLLSSCAILRPDEEEGAEPEKKGGRFEFLKEEERPELKRTSAKESIQEEQVLPKDGVSAEDGRNKYDGLNSSGKPGAGAKAGAEAPKTADIPHFYDDFVLLNGDEELDVSLVFNSAPLLDVLPAFADVLGFNFVADSDLKSVVTLNLNSKMTRRELWNTFDRMLYLAGAGVKAEDSLLRIMALPKLAQQPGSRVGNGILYYPLKNSTAKDIATQLKPFLGTGGVCVELARPNAVLICDEAANIAKLQQVLEAIDQSARNNWPRAAVPCRNILPTKVVEELQTVLPVLGFTVTKTTDKVEVPGAVQLVGIDRLQMIVISAATQDAITEIRKWIDIFDSADSIDQERVFIYKVSHNKAAQLAQALSIIYNTQGASLTIDTSTGNTRTDTISSTATRSTTSQNQNNRTTAAGATATSSTQTDQSSSLFDTAVRVFADGTLNRLVIRTTPRTYASIKALLDRLDVVPAQVLLQVLVVEVTLTDSTKFGIEMSAQGSGSGLNSLLGTNYEGLTPYGETKQDGFTALLSDPNNPENKFGYIRALAGNNAVKVVSSPQLLVSSNTEARIQVGKDIPIITGGVTNSSSGGDVTQTYTYRETGIILTLTPQITSTELISLNITQELSNAVPNTTSTTISSPEITIRQIETSMTVGNGQTMVIGGLIQETRKDDLQSIPFVNDIPFLRRLLGNTNASVERTELLVLVTGYIVDERSRVEELIRRYNEALSSLNQFSDTLGDRAKPRKGATKIDSSEFWK